MSQDVDGGAKPVLDESASSPSDLRRAHEALDEAVDRLYRPAPFSGDRERVEHLFMLYEKLTASLLTMAAAKAKKPRAKRSAVTR